MYAPKITRTIVKNPLNATSSTRKTRVKTVPRTAPTSAPATRVPPSRKSTKPFRRWLMTEDAAVAIVNVREIGTATELSVTPVDSRIGTKRRPPPRPRFAYTNATANTRRACRRRRARSTPARIRLAQIKTRATLYRKAQVPWMDGRSRTVRGTRPEEPVRAPAAPGPARREHPGPLRRGGHRVPHPRGPRPDLRRGGRRARSVRGTPAGLRHRVLQPRAGDLERPGGDRGGCGSPRPRPAPPRRELRDPRAAVRDPPVLEPRPREGPRATRAGRDPGGDRRPRRARSGDPRRGAGEPRIRLRGHRRRPGRASHGEPGARPRCRRLRRGAGLRVARDETGVPGDRRGPGRVRRPRAAPE